MHMLSELDQIKQKALLALESIQDEPSLETWRITHLGRSSPLMLVFDQLGKLAKEERPIIGRHANDVKRTLETAFSARSETLRQSALQQSLQSERLDVTLPGRTLPIGRLHPATISLREVIQAFADMGFQVYRSPEVETDEYNFGLLNMPPDHPARDMWDTFYTTMPNVSLRPHTSPGQIHVMRQYVPEPIRAILPGMCYRYEQINARKETQFNQIEVLVVGKNITLGDLKGTVSDFARRLFGQTIRTRFRASYFPFTEPSAEYDFECLLCNGKGCAVCAWSGWLEIGGCGLVHPTVLQNGGYDPEKFSGFAAGLGTERIMMLKHRIEDIRYFWNNDMRFLEQF
ncbi:MAG: phenylalanine--tRNA ligase subunit alpha [Chloroflexi bacterium RBG_19FT_COMBO_49_13]|nr:MAG: phenylalanine--tRNA ligase subunit alpha [Chloroflexi bacterium RBG_16_47_49]OGO61100.1 MAG: phenylalanine--tRNA ligase subunit alpha [Chloroflexi bacterium RBG_19FT_COMBO_49_13]